MIIFKILLSQHHNQRPEMSNPTFEDLLQVALKFSVDLLAFYGDGPEILNPQFNALLQTVRTLDKKQSDEIHALLIASSRLQIPSLNERQFSRMIDGGYQVSAIKMALP
jgi:hypothetical protein